LGVRISLISRTLSAALFAVPALAGAQVVRGSVTDGGARPLAGVVVALVDSTTAVRARTLSTELGEYSLRAPTAGTYRVQALRIGYRPVLTAPFRLAAGETREQRLVFADVRVTLEAVRVVGRSACSRRSGGSAVTVYAAWDQAMTSIAAASLSASLSASRGLTATTIQLDRTLDPEQRRVRTQSASVRTETVRQPWRSMPAPLLRAVGYTEVDRDGATTYHAPGLDVLSAPEFLEDHCLRLVAASDTAELGVAFEPARRRRDASGIRGTLWLARGTAELRRLEYTYVDVPDAPAVAAGIAGGTMAFTRLSDGSVVISRWAITMPRLERESTHSVRIRVSEIQSTGGELVLVSRGADTLFRRAAIEVAGVVADSLSGAPVPGARLALVGAAHEATTDGDGRFVLRDVLPGAYDLSVRTPSLDSIRASSRAELLIVEGMPEVRLRVPTAAQLAGAFCGDALAGVAGRGKGAVLGGVRDGAGNPVAVTRVAAEWVELIVPTSGGSVPTQRNRRMETRTDSSGAFRLCGVPTESQLLLRALPEAGRSQVFAVRLAPDERFASAVLTIESERTAVASFVGTIVEDSTFAPVADAELLLPDLGLRTRSDSSGAFSIEGIPVGAHRVVARRVGFGALETSLTFEPNEREERRLVLTRVTVLTEVAVVERYLEVGMREFEENRRTGLGDFLTPDDLDRLQGRFMSDAMSRFSGIALLRGGARSYVLSVRRPPSLGDQDCRQIRPGSATYVPTQVERRQGIQCACYAQVWVDGTLMNPGQPAEPFDVNSIRADEVEAVEWYASPAQTPARYSGLNSSCGVLVVHRRRSAPAPAPP